MNVFKKPGVEVPVRGIGGFNGEEVRGGDVVEPEPRISLPSRSGIVILISKLHIL